MALPLSQCQWKKLLKALRSSATSVVWPARGINNGRLAANANSDQQPWHIQKYYTKKLTRETDKLGIIVQSPDTTADMLNDESKMRLAVQVVSRDTGMPEDELMQRVQSLLLVLPDMGGKLQAMKQGDVVQLACRVEDVAAKLLLLKQAFPDANVSHMVAECRHVLLLDIKQFEGAVQEVQSLLAGAGNCCALLDAMPMLLDPSVLSGVLQEMQRLFGATCQPLKLLQQNPSLALSCQSLQAQARGDRDMEYLGDIFDVGGSAESTSG